MRDDRSLRRGATCAAVAVLLVVVAAPWVPALVGDRCILSFDNRLFPPFQVNAPADLAERPRNTVTSDLNGWIVPETALAARELRAGRAPLWNPYAFNGQPLLANLAYTPFYPPSWLALVMDPVRAVAWHVVFHLALAGLFSFLWLRRIGAAPVPALLGALAVALSSWLTVRVHLPMILATAAWLPGMLYALELLLERVTRRRTAGLAATVGMTFLAGFPQVAVLCMIGLGVWFLARLNDARDGAIFLALPLALALGGASSAVQMLPATALYRDSIRQSFVDPAQNAARGLKPVSLLGLALPEFFGSPVRPGEAPESSRDYLAHRMLLDDDLQENAVENALWPGGAALLLAAAAFGMSFRRRRGREREVLSADFASAGRGLALLALLGLLLALRTPFLPWLHEVFPPLASGNPKRALVLVAVPVGLLAGIGAHRLLVGDARAWSRAARASSILGVLLLLAAGAAWATPTDTFADWLAETGATSEQVRVFLSFTAHRTWPRAAGFLVLAGLLFLGRAERRRTLALLGAGALVVLELLPFAARFNPLQERAGQYEETPAIAFLRESGERSVRFGPDAHRLAAALLGPMFPYRSFDGGEPMVLQATGELIEAIEPGRFSRSDPRVAKAFEDPASLTDPRFLRAATPLVVANRPIDGVPGLELSYANEAEGLGIYRQTLALPRARLAGGCEVVADPAERLARLASPDLDPRRAVLVPPLEEWLGLQVSRPLPPPQEPPAASVAIVEERPGRIEVEVGPTDRGAMLVVAESFAEGWRVEGGGPLTAGDHAFLTCVVGPSDGARRVVFTYEPRAFTAGAWVSVVALLLVLLLACLRAGGRDRAAPRDSTGGDPALA